MAYTQADLDAVNAAIASGKKRIRLNNREVEMHSVEQMLKAKADIERDIADAALTTAGTRRPTAYRSRTSKGL